VPLTSGFETVTDGADLVAKLMAAQPNTVIQIPPDMLITFEDLPNGLNYLNIPEGVTLRGNRRDHNDISDWAVAAINLLGVFPANPNACPLHWSGPQDAHTAAFPGS
jgi:hypothetical protein